MLYTAASFSITVLPRSIIGAWAWFVIGAILGVILFLRGFRMLRYKQLILNTPFSKIRSASMGMVEVSGAAKGPRTIPAGITGQACYYYRATAWQLRRSGRDSSWQRVADECLSVPFFVEDPTGRLLVDPQGASLDIEPNFKDEFDTSFFMDNRDILPENVFKFLDRHNINFTSNTRVEEFCIRPDSPMFIFGSLAPNSTAAQWTPTAQVPGTNSLHQVQFSLFGGSTGSPLFSIGVSPISTVNPEFVESLAGAAPATAQSAPRQAPKPVAAAWSSISMDGENMASGNPSAAARTPAPAPQTSALATAEPEGSASDNAPDNVSDSAGFDLCPAAVIRKGPRGEPFMISTHSQREVVRSLAWKSALCIWGGPVLTLICLYLLAVGLGLT